MEPPSNESDRMGWPGNPTGGLEIPITAEASDGGDTGECYQGKGNSEPLWPMPINPSSTAPSSANSPANSCSSSTNPTCGYGRACAEGVALCLSLGEQASDEAPRLRLPSPAILPTSSGSGKSLRWSMEEAGGGSGGRGCNGEFVCNECGLEFTSLRELQLHMVRKTAWSNQGLVGCRVSCLVDNREWHEGVVTQYHKSGKHCIEYRRSGEKRWVNMLRTAFYIVERGQLSGGEVKEMEPDPTEGLAPVEKWTFQEDITLEFCMALSLLHRSYGCRLQETGHKTVGHTCVTDQDKVAARQVKGSLLYGELLPRGVNKAMGPKHLNAAKVSTVFDLGMGTGKVAMQVFLQFPNVTRVYGVELSRARFALGEAALMALMDLQPGVYQIKRHVKGELMSIETLPRPEPSSDAADEKGSSGSATGCGELCRGAAGRTLEFACGNLFDVTDIAQADLVLLETDVSSDIHPQLSRFLMGMKKGAQALTYLDLRKMWGSFPFPFRQVEVNRSLSDRFPTSWSVNRGHHFFLWSKVMPPLEMSSISGDDDEVSSASTSEHKRDHRQGLPGASRLKKGNSGLVGDRGTSLRSNSVRSAASARTSGDVEGSTLEEDEARNRGRRGHPKLLRFPFLGCLGNRKSSSRANHPQGFQAGNTEASVPGRVPVLVPAQNSSHSGIRSNASESSRNPSLHELFLLDANGGGRSALFATGDDCIGVGRGEGVTAVKDTGARVGGDAGVTPPPLPPRPSAVRSSTKPRKLGR